MNTLPDCVKHLGLISLSTLAVAGSAAGASVTFSSMTGSFDQGGGFVAENSIDGNLGSGWGVFGGQNAAQTGVYIPSGPVTASQIQFLLQNRFGSNHYVQEFRISTTTDASPSAGGSTWTPVSLDMLRSTNGTSISAVGGGYARMTGAATGGVADAHVYVAGSFAGVTGFLLEMAPYDFNGADALPATLGRADVNGNFVLSEFTVTTDSDINWALNADVGFFNASGASINAFAPAQAAANIVDGNINTLGHPVGPGNDGYYAQIDLGMEISIDSIDITGRLDSDCCNDRLQDYTLEFYAADGVTKVHDLFHSGVTKATESIDIAASNGGMSPSAQFVRVINTSQAAYGPQIGELAVFGTIPEPSSLVLTGLGLCALLRRRR